MNAIAKPSEASEMVRPSGLDLLRAPFPENQISKLPKPTKRQTEEVRNDYKKGIRCKLCGQWHHPDVVHIDYVGHAALTDRLLDCDPNWNWEPVAFDGRGVPMLDENGGMWIRLTVCDQTRLGYGHPDGKRGGDAIKEVIGDALRNAAMRFGAALDLWHKGDLHQVKDDAAEVDDDGQAASPRQGDRNETTMPRERKTATVSADQYRALSGLSEEAGVSRDQICGAYGAPSLEEFPEREFESAMKKLRKTIDAKTQKNADLGNDRIPY